MLFRFKPFVLPCQTHTHQSIRLCLLQSSKSNHITYGRRSSTSTFGFHILCEDQLCNWVNHNRLYRCWVYGRIPPRKSPFPGKTFPGTALSPNVTPTPSLQCCQPLDHLVVVVAVNAALVVTASSRPAPSSPMHGGSRCPGRTQGRGRDRIPDTIRRRQCSRVRILFYFLQNPKNGLFTFSSVAAHVFSNNGRRRDIS